MPFEKSMWLIEKRWWPKAQEAAGYLNFTREGRKMEWYATEGGIWVQVWVWRAMEYIPYKTSTYFCCLFTTVAWLSRSISSGFELAASNTVFHLLISLPVRDPFARWPTWDSTLYISRNFSPASVCACTGFTMDKISQRHWIWVDWAHQLYSSVNYFNTMWASHAGYSPFLGDHKKMTLSLVKSMNVEGNM